MRKIIMILPVFLFAFFTYCGFAWFCTDCGISDGPIRSLAGFIDVIGEPFFCNLATGYTYIIRYPDNLLGTFHITLMTSNS